MIESPPILTGDEAQRLEALYRYLQRMSEQLEDTLHGLTLENFVPEVKTVINTASTDGASKKELTGQESRLKSIIIKTADIIRSEQEEIRTTLESHYQALSDQFGSYEADLTNRITATAEGILQEYDFNERINSLSEDADEMAEFANIISAYIKTGQVDTDAQGQPIFGVEVGEKMNEPGRQLAARFTKDKLSFFSNGTEVAYMSNSKLYITSAEVLSSMKMGKYIWRVMGDGSMGLVWEG